MEETPTLSVIVPAYNIKGYIRQAVESALRQTWRELEVIVVDDGSSDGTLEGLHDIGDHRLRRILQAHAGLAAARNTGIQAAKGRYLGFLDGDDLWARTKAERHLSFLRDHPEIDVTFSYAFMIDESGREIAAIESRPAGVVSFQDLLIDCPHCSAVVRREALERAGPFDTGLLGSEDLDMWLRIARQRSGNMYCIPEFLAFYRRRGGQLSADWRREKESWQQLYEKFSRLAPEEIRIGEDRANHARHRYYAFLAYEKKRYGEALHLLQQSVRFAPWEALFDGRTWSLTAACLSGCLLPPGIHQFLRHRTAQWRSRSRERDQQSG